MASSEGAVSLWQGSTQVAADGWRTGLFNWLRVWAEFIGCGTPYGELPAAWLNDFNNCYSERGIPQNLTEADRREMLSTLDSLQAHLLSNPEAVDQQLFDRTMGTIEQARMALRTPTPVPVPPPSVSPTTALDLQDGRRS